MTFRNKIAPLMTAVALAVATPLAAQQVQPSDIDVTTLTDDKVNAFVEALIAVEAVRADYLPQIQEQSDEAKQKELIQQANTEALDAVGEVENMTAGDYLAIGQAAQSSEDLNARIMARLESVRSTE